MESDSICDIFMHAIAVQLIVSWLTVVDDVYYVLWNADGFISVCIYLVDFWSYCDCLFVLACILNYYLSPVIVSLLNIEIGCDNNDGIMFCCIKR